MAALGELSKKPDSPINLPSGLFLVGGAVRDLVRGETSADIDLMVEGDAPDFAARLYKNWGELFADRDLVGTLQPLKPVTFPKYRTAKLPFRGEIFPGVSSIDFSSARSEKYPAAGQPPLLEAGDFESDMLRRDFSINALALDLTPAGFGTVIDVAGGVADIDKKIIRVLHPRSFVDDPARIVRACRFAARFDYSFDDQTAALIEQGKNHGVLKTLPRFRFFDEFRKALDEPLAGKILQKLESTGILTSIDPSIQITPEELKLLRAARVELESRRVDVSSYSTAAALKEPIEYWQAALGILYRRCTVGEYQNRLAELGVKPPAASKLSLIRHVVFEQILKTDMSK